MTQPVRSVEVAGMHIAYQELGTGPAVIFLHGFFGAHRIWRRQLDLADSHRVVAWDAPGCGLSTAAPAGWRLGDYAACLAAFIQALGAERPVLVGNSFGGSLALQLCATHPHLPRSLVLADTYAGWSGSFPADVVRERLATSLPDLELPADQVVAKWMPGFVSERAPASAIEEIAAITSDFNPDGMRVMMRALAEADLSDVLPRLSVPVLLIWGDQDVRSPMPVAAAMHAAIRGSRLVLIPGVGHLSQVEGADMFNSVLRSFLRES